MGKRTRKHHFQFVAEPLESRLLLSAPPTATAHNQTVTAGTSIPLTSLFSYSAASGDSISGFDVEEFSNNGYLTDNGVRQSSGVLYGNSTYGIPIGQIGQWAFVAGSGGTTDSIGFNVDDQYGQYNPTVTATVTATNSSTKPTAFTLSNDAPYWDPTPPASPAVMLHWTASTGSPTPAYDIYRNSTLIFSNDSGTSYLNDGTSLTPGATYSYYVVAHNSGGNTQSNTINVTMVNTPSTKPSAFTLSNDAPYWDTTPPASPAVNLHWTASTGSPTPAYDIYRNNTLIYSNDSGTSYLNDGTSLTPGATYSYYVVAHNSGGNTQSNTINVTMVNTPSTKPSAFILSNGTPYWDPTLSEDAVQLNWTTSSGTPAPTYALYRNNIQIYPTTGTTSGTTFLNEGPALTPGGTFSYYVIAQNSAGSTQSNTINVTMANSPVLLPNFVPMNVSVGSSSVQAGNALNVSWTIANTGSGAAAASVTGIRLGTSATSAPGSSSDLVTSYPTPTIAANSSVNQSTTVTISAGTAPGTYYIWIVADNANPGVAQTTASDDFAPSASFTVTAVTPSISSISPNPAAGSNSQRTLTISGTNFEAGAKVTLSEPAFGFTSSPLTPTSITSTQIQLSATLGNDATTWNVYITSGGLRSNTATFSVTAPVPAIASVSPSSIAAGSAAFTLTVNGTTFEQASVVRWNGANLTTTPVVNSGLTTALTATVPAADIASAGTDAVTVYSSGLGGGTSASMNFTVNSAGPLTYDRSAAVAYANQYAFEVVSDGYFWINGSAYNQYAPGSPVPVNAPNEDGGIGDDCAHFVSSCIGTPAGGLNIPSRVPPTYGEPGAPTLDELLISEGYAEQVSSINQLQPGDVIGYDWDGSGGGSMNGIDHTVVYLGNGEIAGHSISHDDVAWNWNNSGSTETFFIHILGNAADQPPTIGSLSATPNPLPYGQPLTLTANSVSDGDGTISKVEFWWDLNDNGTLDTSTDTLLGTDTSSSGGWTWAGALDIPTGSNRFFARAQDNGGDWSNPVSATVTVESAGPSHPTVPAYSSRPGAPYTIYLDFAGFDYNGTWISFAPGNTPAYDDNGNSTSFSSSEIANIENVWSRVAEGYASFDINVTTVDPAVAAGQAGSDLQRQNFYDNQPQLMHTVIGGGGSWFGSAGGVTISTGKTPYATSGGAHTNWVFAAEAPDNLQFIADAAAHENGHGLGLSHQSDYNGTTLATPSVLGGVTPGEYSAGSNGLAPIMGVAYTAVRGLWAVGTADINNNVNSPSAPVTQNDAQIIANDPNMGGVR